jgi:hypothetical protein
LSLLFTTNLRLNSTDSKSISGNAIEEAFFANEEVGGADVGAFEDHVAEDVRVRFGFGAAFAVGARRGRLVVVVAVLQRPLGVGDRHAAAGGVEGVTRLARGEERELAEAGVVRVVVRRVELPAATGSELFEREPPRLLLFVGVDGAANDQRREDDEDQDYEHGFHGRRVGCGETAG